jgi:hypothetical protein
MLARVERRGASPVDHQNFVVVVVVLVVVVVAVSSVVVSRTFSMRLCVTSYTRITMGTKWPSTWRVA